MHLLLTNEYEDLFIPNVVTYTYVVEGIRIALPHDKCKLLINLLDKRNIPFKFKETGVTNTVIQFSVFDYARAYYNIQAIPSEYRMQAVDDNFWKDIKPSGQFDKEDDVAIGSEDFML